ncbi:MAG: CDP-alcohol phosphatidyltransferase family protein [Candidatus Cloacimonetes bacterium]|nr:CDP-alcohol phosphatidyltransferase family protein [Candidatus Cloacimonadota bacterium]
MDQKVKTKKTITLKVLLPNFFTALSLGSAILGITLITRGNFQSAIICIIFSMFFDGIDGKLARLLGVSSQFGALFDTVTDFIAFGLTPIYLAYQLILSRSYPWGLIICLVYISSGGFRLIRYMHQNPVSSQKQPFTGLPIPASAGFIAACSLFVLSSANIFGSPVILGILVLVVSYLMVSRIKYQSLDWKNLPKRSLKIFILLLIISVILAVKYFNYVFFLWMIVYLFSGISGYLSELFTTKGK